ncbi:hypothetical protein ACFL23_00635 [Patescibacteria group bacterium]
MNHRLISLNAQGITKKEKGIPLSLEISRKDDKIIFTGHFHESNDSSIQKNCEQVKNALTKNDTAQEITYLIWKMKIGLAMQKVGVAFNKQKQHVCIIFPHREDSPYINYINLYVNYQEFINALENLLDFHPNSR